MPSSQEQTNQAIAQEQIATLQQIKEALQYDETEKKVLSTATALLAAMLEDNLMDSDEYLINRAIALAEKLVYKVRNNLS